MPADNSKEKTTAFAFAKSAEEKRLPYIVQVKEVLLEWAPKFSDEYFWGHCLFDADEPTGYSCGIKFKSDDWHQMENVHLYAKFFEGVHPPLAGKRQATFYSGPQKIFRGDFLALDAVD